MGNDFIVLDARKDPKLSSAAEPKRATALTDRKIGIVSRCMLFPGITVCSELIATSLRSNRLLISVDDSRCPRCALWQGCDQLIILEKSEEANCIMRIINADGSEVQYCNIFVIEPCRCPFVEPMDLYIYKGPH